MFLGVLIYYYDMTFNFFFKKIIFKKKNLTRMNISVSDQFSLFDDCWESHSIYVT